MTNSSDVGARVDNTRHSNGTYYPVLLGGISAIDITGL